MTHRIFCTGVLPEHLIAKYKLSFAACNFSFNLISGGGFDKVYSIMPLYTGGEMDKEAFEDSRFQLVYDKWRGKGILCQRLAVVKEQWNIFKKIPKDSIIWFYNLNSLNALLFILLKIFKPSVQLNIIILDFTPITNGIGLNSFFLKLINTAHGRISLTKSPLFNPENSVTLPGVVPYCKEVLPFVEKTTAKFLLSGALNEVIAQTSMVLDAFSRLPECELHITGSQNVKKVKEYADKYPNIIYHEQLEFANYFELLHSITFQLSTRDASYPENQCNFPSKIIEALLHNRAIVSTIRYPQLEGVKYFVVPSNVEEFTNEIKRIASMGYEDLEKYINQGEKMNQMFSTDVWYETMKQIENI